MGPTRPLGVPGRRKIISICDCDVRWECRYTDLEKEMAQQPQEHNADSLELTLGVHTAAITRLFRSVEQIRSDTAATNVLVRRNTETLDRLLQVSTETREVARANAIGLARTQERFNGMRRALGDNRAVVVNPPTLPAAAETGAWQDEGDEEEGGLMVDRVLSSYRFKSSSRSACP